MTPPYTELGRKLLEIRGRAIANGYALLSEEEIAELGSIDAWKPEAQRLAELVEMQRQVITTLREENKRGMTLTELQHRCYAQAQAKGWTEQTIPIPEMLVLIHSEASEGLESYRNHEPLSWTSEAGKPEGLASEFADILIRIGHYAELLQIDLDYEVERKLRYNLTREHRHGGKCA